nr:uncharacterized protein CXorf66 homolog [Cavia porcellus]
MGRQNQQIHFHPQGAAIRKLLPASSQQERHTTSVKTEDVEAKSSFPCILPLSESKTKDLNLCSPGKKALLPNTENESRPSIPEKSAPPSKAEKLVKQPSCKSSVTSPELTELLSSSDLKKSRETQLKQSHKLACAYKQAEKVSSPDSPKPVRTPLQASLQSLRSPSESLHKENKILSRKAKKLAMSPGNYNLKTSESVSKADKVSKPPEDKTGQCAKERSLVCKTSEALANNIFEGTKENAGYLVVLSKMVSFSRLGPRGDSQEYDHFMSGNMSDNDMIHYTDDDSDREVTIICNITSNDILAEISD